MKLDRQTARALADAGYMSAAEYVRFTEEEAMTTHTVKSWPEFFDALVKGQPFDLRHNDRHYKAGDFIVFSRFDDRTGRFTGETLKKRITHVFTSTGPGAITPYHGLSATYAILGLADA